MRRKLGALVSMLTVVLGCQAVPTPALAVDASQAPQGWTLQRSAANACVADGPTSGGASLHLAADGPLFMLLVEAGDLPAEKGSYEVSLQVNGGAPAATVGLVDGGILEIRVGLQDAKRVSGASRIAVTVGGARHEFSLARVSEVLDALARCAGAQTLAERAATPPETPIPGAPGWTLALHMPGTTARACVARKRGPQIDTNLMLNDLGQLVLIGGHPDWATFGAEVPLKLSIDGGAPVVLPASAVENLILVSIKDQRLLDRLRRAKTLDWTIPTGHVRGDVTGLGVALDAVRRCKAAAAD